jgi:glutamate 5-kinase
MKIVVKVGTQSILSEDGTPLESVLESLVEQIVTLQQAGHQLILVSSGAVASGRKVARQMLGREYGTSLGEKQVLASLGQHELIHVYARMLRKHNILASQLLLTKLDFHTRQHYLNISRLLHEILTHKNIVPIINENDSVAVSELMFTDNDELAGLIAAQIGADKLVILSNVEGVYTGHPADPDARLIPIINPEEGWPEISERVSQHGRGGMISKLSTARKMSSLGIATHIASMSQPNVLIRMMSGEDIGTLVLSAHKKSTIKRWIAFSTGQKHGSVWVNTCLYDLLKENKRVMSILPVGIEKAEGDFMKNDLVDILSPQGEKIGVGIAKYDAVTLQAYCGKKDMPIFIHHDHLYIY